MKSKIIFTLIAILFSSKIFAAESQENSSENINSLQALKKLKTQIESPYFIIDGRAQIDFGIPTKNDINNTNNISSSARRLWLGASGTITKNLSYRILTGFESNLTRVHDAFLKYEGLKGLDIFAGNFIENNGLDIGSGNLVTPLMERSSGISTFKRFRRIGLSINPYGDNWGLHLGFFGNNFSNPNSSANNANNRGHSISTRGHIDLINDTKNKESLHIGINNSYRWLSQGTDPNLISNRTMRFSSGGSSGVLTTTLIDSGNILNVRNYYQNMLEFRYQNGPLTITSEYIKTTLNPSNSKSINFNGAYIMSSYFLGSESYGYDVKQGIQTLPIIDSNGAWEIAARYSVTNLNDGNIRGGKLNSYDFGLNYYPNNNIKLMANYIFEQTDNNSRVKQNPQYLMFRTQFNF